MKFLKNFKYFEVIRWKCILVFKYVLFEDFVVVVCENVFFYIIIRYFDYSLYILICCILY